MNFNPQDPGDHAFDPMVTSTNLWLFSKLIARMSFILMMHYEKM